MKKFNVILLGVIALFTILWIVCLNIRIQNHSMKTSGYDLVPDNYVEEPGKYHELTLMLLEEYYYNDREDS